MVNLRKYLIFIVLSVLTLSVTIFVKGEEETSLPSFSETTEFVNSNRYTQKDDYEEAIPQMELDSSYDILSTSMGKVYYNPENLAIMFYSQGYLWSSAANAGGFNTKNKKNYSSAIIISYYKDASTAPIQESLATNENTEITIKKDNDSMTAHIFFGESEIEMDLYYTFTSDGFNVKIPEESIKENNAKKILGDVSLYWMLGAVKGNGIKGYMVIPDGIGALVRYENRIAAPEQYTKFFYNNNLMYKSDSNLSSQALDMETLSIPIFGLVHGVNQNAIMGNIVSGSECAALNIWYGFNNASYTAVFPTFYYRSFYKQPTNQSGSTISLVQSEKNHFDVEVSYNLLSGDKANYIGIANEYQDFLEKNDGIKKISKSGDSPLLLDTIMLEISKGDFFNKRLVMTTFTDFKTMALTLKNEGINSIVGEVEGYTNKGYSNEAPIYHNISKSLGNSKNMTELYETMDDVYFMMDLVKATENSGGYSSMEDLAKKVNLQNYSFSDNTINTHLLTIKKTESVYEKNVRELKKKGVNSFGLFTLPSTIYSDYNNNTSKKDMISAYQELTKNGAAMSKPNAYLFMNSTAYLDMDLYSSQYLGFTDTIPLLPLILASYMEIYASNANFYANAKDDLLRLIDFNVNLSFVVTKKSSSLFLETPLEDIYSSEFKSLKDAIIIYYNFVNEPLKMVRGATLTSREVAKDGIIVNTYSNGVSIIINYNAQEVEYMGSVIPSKGYKVLI